MLCAGSRWSGWRVPRPALGQASPAGQLFGANDVGVARVGRQRLWPHAGGAVAFADVDLPHHNEVSVSADGSVAPSVVTGCADVSRSVVIDITGLVRTVFSGLSALVIED